MASGVSGLKVFLDAKSDEFNVPGFIKDDPISVPHHFQCKQDIEISGFMAATLAWGQRPVIISSALKIMQMMDDEPYEFLSHARDAEYGKFVSFVHRTFNGDDCLFLLNAFRSVYREFDSLEYLFANGYRKELLVKDGISEFRKRLLFTPHLQRSEKHIADPHRGSAAKRLNMFLRWMVRSDGRGVDFGIWKTISPAHLMCPLDLHSGRIARRLGLLSRKQDDWKAVEELTNNLRKFDPTDPVKYDFALFGIGTHEKR